MNKSAQEHDFCAFEIAKKTVRKSGFNPDECVFSLYKKSVDARKKNAIVFNYTVSFANRFAGTKYSFDAGRLSRFGIVPCEEKDISVSFGNDVCQTRPVVVGFGPCGMFCAYTLALYGFRPIVIERGSQVEKRIEDVKKYWNEGELSEESNVQFGEGGAGTFSDGKLLTRINNPLCSYVIDTFHKFGAPDEILYTAKPHIGTDNLVKIVKNIRNEIIRLGGTFHFDTSVIDIQTNGNVKHIFLSNGEILLTDDVFLCIGHSARDTFSMLLKRGFELVPKAFSIGVRIEHLQEDIDKALYGSSYENPALPKGEYTLSTHVGQRAVYSFCMCPGGVVVASSSEKSGIVTNGMSNSKRDEINANSAIAVSISPADYGSDIISAVNFQKNIEERAFNIGGKNGAAPVCTLQTLLSGDVIEPKRVLPTYTGKIKICDVRSVFPSFVTDPLSCAFADFEKKIKGFSVHDAVITAPETRTSSPVRISRNADTFYATKFQGIYPCGEGAGYAGGITSAAVDGISAAMSFMKKYKNAN